jgi:proteasome lid subunit RPN8/RPN11
MIPVVKLHRSQLDYFRRLARNTTKEVHAFLVGTIVSPQLVRIEHFAYSQYEEQTPCSVTPTAADQKKIEQWTLENDMKVVGTIHSHPNWDAVLSPDDYKGHIEEAHRISGVCSTQARKTRVRFWLAESSLPCKVEYL